MRFSPRVAFGRWYETPELDDIRVRGLLEMLTQTNAYILGRNPHLPGIYESGARYGFEFDFYDVLAVLDQGGGKCAALGPYRAGELRARHGIAAVCDCTKTWNARLGRYDYHVLVKLPNGATEDPSRRLGMP